MTITFFTFLRKNYHSRRLDRSDPQVTTGKATVPTWTDHNNKSPATNKPNTFLSTGGTRSRTSTVLETFRRSILGKKREKIPSFEPVVVTSSPSLESNTGSGLQQNSIELPPNPQPTELEETRSGVHMALEILGLSSDLSPNGEVSSQDHNSEWAEEADVTLVADTQLASTNVISSALLEKLLDSKLSPLSSVAAYYESASLGQGDRFLQYALGKCALAESNTSQIIKTATTIISESSSVFLTPMSPSDFDLAHDEVFGFSPPETPRIFKPL